MKRTIIASAAARVRDSTLPEKMAPVSVKWRMPALTLAPAAVDAR